MSGSRSSDRPNLEQKKKQAKELLKAVRGLDGQAALRFTWNLPRFRGKSDQDVIQAGVTLADAQAVIARESGFESWARLTRYVRTLETDPDGPVAAFENAVRAIIRGDIPALRRLLDQRPELATARSPRERRSVLPHYLAANGVEDEHQITPPNAVEVARLLFAAGADAVVNATSGAYGGGGGSTPLVALVTSSHPHDAGVQAELVQVFCDAGAQVDGIDDDGLPLASAIGFRYPAAAVALVDCGARVDNLPAAAAAGQLKIVRRMLDPDGGLPSEAVRFQNPDLKLPRSVAPHPEASLQQAFVFACMAGEREIAQLLLDAGVDVNGAPRKGVTALHEAIHQADLPTVRFLLDRGADPTQRDSNWNSTPFGWCDPKKSPEIVEEILSRGKVDFLDVIELGRLDVVRSVLAAEPALANAPAGQGMALRYAAFHGNVELARLLLEFGADPALANAAGNSAVDYARKAGQPEIVALFDALDAP